MRLIQLTTDDVERACGEVGEDVEARSPDLASQHPDEHARLLVEDVQEIVQDSEVERGRQNPPSHLPFLVCAENKPRCRWSKWETLFVLMGQDGSCMCVRVAYP